MKVFEFAPEAGAFLRSFLIHILPKGFTRIRHCGNLASVF
ncbi:transposase [Echinicola vietnamensis]